MVRVDTRRVSEMPPLHTERGSSAVSLQYHNWAGLYCYLYRILPQRKSEFKCYKRCILRDTVVSQHMKDSIC